MYKEVAREYWRQYFAVYLEVLKGKKIKTMLITTMLYCHYHII